MLAPNHGKILNMSPCDYTLPKKIKKNHGVTLKKSPFNKHHAAGKKYHGIILKKCAFNLLKKSAFNFVPTPYVSIQILAKSQALQ